MLSTKLISPLLALTLCVCPCFASEKTEIPFNSSQILLEVVGQVNNSGSDSVQFGYAARVAGIDNAFSANAAADQNESTARFTFYTEVVNRRVTTNGPLTIIVREGTTTLYLNALPGDFGSPDSFRSGMPIQTSVIHQQVIVDAVEKTFTVVNSNTISSTEHFWLDGTEYELGDVGQIFKTRLRSEEHTSELQSQSNLVCRLLLEKKKKK